VTDEGSGPDGSEQDISAADQQALTDLFASLVADAPAFEVSPLEIVELGRIEQRHALDSRVKRFRVVRNLAVAAAVVAMVVLIIPHLGSSSSESTAAASSSSSAAAASGSPSPQAGVAAAGSAAGSGNASGSAAGSEAESAGGTSAAAASGAMSAAAPAAVAGSSASTSGAGCPMLPARALEAFETAFPIGYYGRVTPDSSAAPCVLFESRLPVVKQNETVTVAVRRAAVGACRQAGCEPVAGQPGVYGGDASAGPGVLVVGPFYVYADGYEVAVVSQRTVSPIGASFDQLVAGARAVLGTLD
jgi:hypothetical protein